MKHSLIKRLKKPIKRYLLPVIYATVVSGGAIGGAISLNASPSLAAGTVPGDVQTAIDDSTATVQALSPLALAALAVALVPFGVMLTLKFLNMIMARA